MTADAEAQKRWRERHREEALRRSRAQSRALWRLKQRHAEEFRALYREEYDLLGAIAVDG